MIRKKYFIDNLIEYEVSPTGYLMEVIAHEVRDEYHSMAELYDVRRALCIQLFNAMASVDFDAPFMPTTIKSKLHNDGTMFPGYFIVAAWLNGKQISFHYELEHWDKFKIPEVERVPWPYDGHTTRDVIERLEA